MGTAPHLICIVASITCPVSRAGLYSFFVIFGLSMLVLLITLGMIILWFEGYTPEVVVLARAHGTSPSKVIRQALAQRRAPSLERLQREQSRRALTLMIFDHAGRFVGL